LGEGIGTADFARSVGAAIDFEKPIVEVLDAQA
jgi:hypothetical protein